MKDAWNEQALINVVEDPSEVIKDYSWSTLEEAWLVSVDNNGVAWTWMVWE